MAVASPTCHATDASNRIIAAKIPSWKPHATNLSATKRIKAAKAEGSPQEILEWREESSGALHPTLLPAARTEARVGLARGTMIDAAGRKVRIPTLLIAVLLPFQPLLSACSCEVRDGSRREGVSGSCCCAPAGNTERAVSSRPGCCPSDRAPGAGCYTRCAACGTSSDPVSDPALDSSCRATAAGAPVPALAGVLPGRTAPTPSTTGPARTASAPDVCSVLCRYQL